MIAVVEERKRALAELCRRLGVSRLDLFGSAATGAFRGDTGDLDFVVVFADTSPGGYADRYLALAEALEELFSREVDLVTERAIRNPFFREAVEATRRPIYDARDDQTAA